MGTITAEDVKKLLGLQPHPREGGWYRRTWESKEFLPPTGFHDERYSGLRQTSTAIYYLLEPGTFSQMHRLQSDEIFHHYMGASVEMLQLFPDGRSEFIVIGSNLLAGERPQHVVPRGVWQGCRILAPRGWALLGCTVSPGFEFADYSDASAAELMAKWPTETDRIRALTHG